jgi:hypothetical protein
VAPQIEPVLQIVGSLVYQSKQSKQKLSLAGCLAQDLMPKASAACTAQAADGLMACSVSVFGLHALFAAGAGCRVDISFTCSDQLRA